MLTQGPETDLKVAQACGIDIRLGDDRIRYCRESKGSPYFCPSTDLNCAFFAADAFGLFKDHVLSHVNGWRIFRWDEEFDRDAGEITRLRDIANEETPCLAICAAILKLRENT